MRTYSILRPPEGIEGEDGDDSSLLSLTRKLGLVVLLRHLLLSLKTPIDSWMVLLEEGRESHCVITGLNPLCPTIQSSTAREEISEGALYWIERGTLLI